MKRNYIVLFVVTMHLFLFGGTDISFAADTGDISKVVRVGWYIVPGLQDRAADMSPSGYNYEYLREIQNYTHWKYEFVPCTWQEAEQGLLQGNIDIVGDVAKTDDRLLQYNYSAYPAGKSHMIIACRLSDNRFAYEDYGSFDGKVVATISSSFRKSLLEREAKKHQFSVSYKEYPTEQKMFEGLELGETDLAIFSNVTKYKEVKVVSEWEANPFYFVVNKDRPDLLGELNYAMKRVETMEPFIQNRLFQKYFSDDEAGNVIAYTKEEMDYVAQNPRIKVLVLKNSRPFSYKSKDGSAAGIAIDYVKELVSKCGLETEFIFCEDYAEMEKYLRRGEGDICIRAEDDLSFAQLLGLTLLPPYLTMEYVMVNQMTDKRSIDTVAVVRGSRGIIEHLQSMKLHVEELRDTEACLDAVADGKVDGAVLSRLEYEHQGYHGRYQQLVFHVLSELDTSACIGISDRIDKKLFLILQKSSHAISNAKINKIIAQNSLVTYEWNFYDYLTYGRYFIQLTIFLFIIICGSFFWNRRQKRFNLKLRNEKLRADQATTAKDVFFSRMSHDMRTPLNGVIGYSELALEAEKTETMKDYLQKIRISGKLLLALVNDLLDFSKYMNHKMKVRSEVISLEKLCTNLETIVRPLVIDKNLSFHIEHHAVYDGMVETDYMRIQQLIVNLISNSVKFTSSGGHVELLVHEEDMGEWLACVFCVRDDGIGMTKEFLPRIFDAYSQEDRSQTLSTIGTGLGMAIVKQIVDLMDGTIQVESEVNVGTAFTVRLHMKKCKAVAVEAISVRKTILLDVLQGKSVLLCEDNELNAEIIQLILQQWHMEVVWVNDGQKAVEAISKKNRLYDIILMDKRMPVMDGIEAAKAIRSLPHQQHIPIIALTADADEGSIQACIDAGMEMHVAKPIDRHELAEAMIELLKKYNKLSIDSS